MFRHLRNRLIAMTLIVTTIVLGIAFSSIYAVAFNAAHHRQDVVADLVPGSMRLVVQTMSRQIEAEQRESLRTLLTTLLVTGFAVEVVVAFLAYVLAETAIQPIKEVYDTQKTFIANASHEMKTPIAAIMANLEVADIQNNPWIDNVNQEVKYMADLNQNLLTLARAENSMSIAKSAETVVLKQFVEEIIQPFQPRIQQQKVKLQLKTQLKSGKVKLVKSDFQQIVSILIDNALKYCDKSILIELTSKSLCVVNDGTKISAEDLPKVFDRFYQTNKSSEGVGLGLAIAKAVAEHNGWKLQVASDEVTRFTLSF